MYFSGNQWQFWRGWHNDFDLVRVAFEWRDYRTAKLLVSLVGFRFVVEFRAYSVGHIRQFMSKCSECGRRFGHHDESIEHLPF